MDAQICLCFKFTKSMLEKKKIELFNEGHHERDFTYVDDIINGIMLIILKATK